MSVLKLPLVTKAYYSADQIPKVKAGLIEIKAKFSTFIRSVSLLTRVPEELIIAFIYIESGGNASVINKSSGAAGLMQLVAAAANDILHLENKQGRLQDAEKEILRKYLGNRLDCILSMKYMAQKLPCNGNKGNVITKADLLKPELNILIGAIYLGILMAQFTENTIVRLDKIVIKYNRGFFSKIKGSTVSQVYAAVSGETRSYIEKLTGPNNVIALQA